MSDDTLSNLLDASGTGDLAQTDAPAPPPDASASAPDETQSAPSPQFQDTTPQQPSSLTQAISDLGGSQQPQQQPQQPPAPGSTWKNVLMGALSGLARGGVVGAGAGAAFGNDLAKQRSVAQQTAQANLSYEQQKAMQAVQATQAQHNAIEQQDTAWKEAQFDRGLNRVTALRDLGASPIGIVQDNASAAAQITSQMVGNHQIPIVIHLPAEDGSQGHLAVYDATQFMKAPTVPLAVKDGLDKLGMPVPSDQDWAQMSQDQRYKLTQQGVPGIHQAPAGTTDGITAQINTLRQAQLTYAVNHKNDPRVDDAMSEYKDEIKSLQTAQQAIRDNKAADANAQTQVKAQQAGAIEAAKVRAKNANTPAKPQKPQTDMLTGTINGQQVYGSADELKSAGVQNMTKTPALIQTKVEAARELLEPNGLFDNVNADLRQLVKDGKIGVAASRWSDFMAGKVGSEPEFQQLRTDMGLLATKLMQAHVGNRGGKDMLEHFESLADYHISDAPTLRAALQREYQYVHGMAGRVQNAQNQNAAQNPNGQNNRQNGGQ